MKKTIAILAVLLMALVLSGCCIKHDYAPATCTEPETCTKCGKTRGEPLGHTEEIDEAIEPTCTETGLTEGSHCSVCGEVLVAQEEIPALGHTEEIDEAIEPTCTETGLTVGSHCSVCGEVLIAQEEIPALGHTEEIDEAVEPSCTEAGLTEGSHCSVCGEVLIEQEVIPALGHTVVIDKAVEPTCTEAGLTEGSHCSVCSEVLVAQEAIPALGHTVVIDKAIDPTCTETGLTEGSHCSVCGEVLTKQEIIPALGHSWIEATCTKPKTCSVCGETEGEALGHEWKPATWTQPKTCSVCGETEGKSILDSYSVADKVNLSAAISNELQSRVEPFTFDVPVGKWTVGQHMDSGLYSLANKELYDYSYFDVSLSQFGGGTFRLTVNSLKGPISHLLLEDGDTINIESAGLKFSAGTYFPSYADADPSAVSEDLSAYSETELKELYQLLVQKLAGEELPVQVLPGGIWVVGQDVPAGTYDVKAFLDDNYGNFSFSVFSGKSNISSFGDHLNLYGFGRDEETTLNLELEDGNILVVSSCNVELTVTDGNVFFGPGK